MSAMSVRVWQAFDSCLLKATGHFNVTNSNCDFIRRPRPVPCEFSLYIYFASYLFIFCLSIRVCDSMFFDRVRVFPSPRSFSSAVNASETRTNTLCSFVVILKWCNESGWRKGPGAMTALCWLGCARDALKRGYCHETDWKCHFPL